MPLTPQITLTATLSQITGDAAGTSDNPASMVITLCNYGLTLPQIPGTSSIAQKTITVLDDGSSDPVEVMLWGNDVITPVNSTYYQITVIDGAGNIVQTGNYFFSGTQTIDLSEATQVYPVPQPPTPPPPGAQGITQLNGDVLAGPGTGLQTAKVVGLQTYPLASTSPVLSDVIVCRADGEWAVGQLTADDILPGFSIDYFTINGGGGINVEIGATVTNPVFAAGFSSAIASADITNTDGIDSPLALPATNPTGGTVTGSFVKTTQASTTFELSANSTASVNRTASVAIGWYPYTYGGVAAAGATGATASGNNATLTGPGTTINNVGLGDTYVGQTFPVYSPSNQKVYLLIQGGSHTFKDALTGFAFAFNTPTHLASFMNQHGATVDLYLYEGTNLLTGNFQPEVFS